MTNRKQIINFILIFLLEEKKIELSAIYLYATTQHCCSLFFLPTNCIDGDTISTIQTLQQTARIKLFKNILCERFLNK